MSEKGETKIAKREREKERERGEEERERGKKRERERERNEPKLTNYRIPRSFSNSNRFVCKPRCPVDKNGKSQKRHSTMKTVVVIFVAEHFFVSSYLYYFLLFYSWPTNALEVNLRQRVKIKKKNKTHKTFKYTSKTLLS